MAIDLIVALALVSASGLLVVPDLAVAWMRRIGAGVACKRVRR